MAIPAGGMLLAHARLKSLHSPDVSNLAAWSPEEETMFGFPLQAMIGPTDGDGAGSFDILVCSPAWLEREMSGAEIRSGQHTLLMSRYNHRMLLRYLERRVDACEAPTWLELARQLGSIGRWEFDSYPPEASLNPPAVLQEASS